MANNDNIIYAKFNHGREITTDSRSQYAYGQVLKISGLHLPASFDADISNKGDKQAVPRIGTDNELPIDDTFFLSGKDVIVMINVHAADKDGRTKYIVRIPVEKRPERADIELEPVEQDVISVAIATLNEAVEQTSASAESAENSANRAHESAINAEQSATNAFNSEALVEQYMNRAETAANGAERSETKAKTSEVNAKASETHTEQIATEIEQFTSRAETASTNAESSASTASQKATEALNSAGIATTKATEASTSATNAHNSETSAQQSASSALESKNSASASASTALVNAEKTQSDRQIVELAKSDVLSAVSDAQSYATTAQSASQAIQDMDVEAVTLEAGSDVSVEKTIDPVTGAVTLTYGIPKGVKGDKGDKGDTGAKGDPFVYSDFTPEQLASLKGEKGDKGDQGIQGEKGDTGIQGVQGERGEKGDTGTQGIQGEKGDKGDKGDNYVLTQADKEEIAELVDTPVDDVQVNGTSIVQDGVANVPVASANNLGVIKLATPGNYDNGIAINEVSQLYVSRATDAQIKNGVQSYKPIVPSNQHMSTFYGLAKAAGDSTQSQSDNAIGTYTDEAKTSIKTMLGVEDPVVDDVQINDTSIVTDGVANIPVGGNNLGVVKENLTYGIDITGSGQLLLITPSDIELKRGYSGTRRAIMTLNQHIAAFYGLAKAAGDTTQSASSNEVGTYTDEAKTAIKQMLGVKDDYDSLVVEVSGTDPVITGKPSYRYNCGELYTLSITPPESGTMDIIFTSGTTPTILTLPNTVKMPDWWAGIETNTTYEMCITDGTYCGVMSWAT